MFLYRVGKVVCPPVFKVLYRYRLQNRFHVPEGQGAVLCSNHISVLDPLFVAFSQRRTIRFMAKKELFQNPVAGAFLRGLGGFSVDRGRTDITAIDTAVELLKNGELLGIFPEGTRSRDGEPLKPKAGAAMLAFRAGCPVLPIALAAEKGRVKAFRRVIIRTGRLMSLDELGLTEGSGIAFRNATRRIWEEVNRLRQEARALLVHKK